MTSNRRNLLLDRTAASAVEFAIIAPVFMAMFVATVDVGFALYAKFELNAGVSAAANYAIVNAANVNSSTGASLAKNLASIVANQVSPAWSNATVVVNNGPSAILTSGILTTNGAAANADKCYCPGLSGGVLNWGAALSCGVSCTNGGVAGKFVAIAATTPYTSLFGSNGIIPSATLISNVIVETN